jgi:hypothetical protein
MSRRQLLKQHGLRRQDYPDVYHWRAAVRRATLPPPWPVRGRWIVNPYEGTEESVL